MIQYFPKHQLKDMSSDEMWLQEDGASSHKAGDEMSLLADNIQI